MPCSSGSGSKTSSGSKKSGKVLACANCQQRKKKCDKRSPCSFCVKHNATCVPSTPAPPRRRRQPTKELLERMSRCEDLLRQCLDQGVFVPKHSSQQQDNPPKESLDTNSAAASSTVVDRTKSEDDKVDSKEAPSEKL